ncbi:hypothetical protein HHI36_001661, partial [Cryptolaemus montrouzieri]
MHMEHYKSKERKKKETEENCLLPQDFSNFFAQVADKLIDKIPNTKDDPLEYLKGLFPPTTEFEFREVTLVELRDIINQMKNKKSSDIYGMTVEIVMSLRNLIISPLTKLINHSIRSCVFPRVLK